MIENNMTVVAADPKVWRTVIWEPNIEGMQFRSYLHAVSQENHYWFVAAEIIKNVFESQSVSWEKGSCHAIVISLIVFSAFFVAEST